MFSDSLTLLDVAALGAVSILGLGFSLLFVRFVLSSGRKDPVPMLEVLGMVSGQQQARPQPAKKTPRWQVKFAGEWHECQMVGDNGDAGKLIRVHLPGRPDHLTTRLPDEIRQV